MKLNINIALRLLSVMLLFTVCMNGCNRNKTNMVSISGTVTLDGQPLEQGAITFYPEDGETSGGGGSIKDGKFTANVPPGKKKVTVLGTKVVGMEKLYDTPDSPTRDKVAQTTPEIYDSYYSSPLRTEVTKEKKEYNFELDSKVQK